MATPTIRLHPIEIPARPDAVADVVFVHGLGGNHLTTWHPEGQPDAYWPLWLSQDIPTSRVWGLGYPAGATRWTSDSSEMGLLGRSKNILEFLSASGIGDRPVVFVAHSLGGVLVKQLLYTADTLNIAKWRPLSKNTRGVVFLATPHAGSSLSQLASALSLVMRPSKIVKDLEQGSEYLQQLSHWFAQNAGRLGIKVEAYYETSKVKDVLIVDNVSANPGVFGCVPVGADGNHFTVCKPETRDELIYLGVCKFIRETISVDHQPRKPLRAYFIPGYTPQFRALRRALSSHDSWKDCELVEEDASRLQYGISQGEMDDTRCHVMFIDLVGSERVRRDTRKVLELIRLTRSLGRDLSFKPIFVFFSNDTELRRSFERLNPSDKSALERYFRLEPTELAEDLREKLQVLHSRITAEWMARPSSSKSLL